jgi:hypothetical protein
VLGDERGLLSDVNEPKCRCARGSAPKHARGTTASESYLDATVLEWWDIHETTEPDVNLASTPRWQVRPLPGGLLLIQGLRPSNAQLAKHYGVYSKAEIEAFIEHAGRPPILRKHNDRTPQYRRFHNFVCCHDVLERNAFGNLEAAPSRVQSFVETLLATASSPVDRTVARTNAPARRASCTAHTPTAPAPPWMRTVRLVTGPAT